MAIQTRPKLAATAVRTASTAQAPAPSRPKVSRQVTKRVATLQAVPVQAATSGEGDEGRQSPLARGVRLLQCFTMAEPMLASKDLVERSGLPKPTAFRTIQSLRELGLLEYSERRGRYMLGPALLALCPPLLSGMTIRSLARPMMQEFADYAQGLVTVVAGTASQRPVFVEMAQGRGNTVFRPELGTTTSLSRSSSGRAWLVLLDEADRERQLARLGRTDAGRAQWLRPKLDQTRDELQRQGYCRNLGELDPITVGVAVPVHVPIDGCYYVFGCTVPSYRLVESPRLLEDLGMRLATLVQNVEGALGTRHR
jgi:DNA-binding IclR family transcriptional regulator